MEEQENISLENGDVDVWICICGNMPSDDGFYPCNSQGNHVEPTEKLWTTDLYVCDRCGRMINSITLAVEGRNRKIAARHERTIASNSAQMQRDFEEWQKAQGL
jgi:hypothetical protein